MIDHKYYYIGDLIRFYSVRIVVNPAELTAPDGTKRSAWAHGISPMLEIAENLI